MHSQFPQRPSAIAALFAAAPTDPSIHKARARQLREAAVGLRASGFGPLKSRLRFTASNHERIAKGAQPVEATVGKNGFGREGAAEHNRRFKAFGAALLAGVAATALAACSDTGRARMAAHYSDRPATIRCVGWGGVIVDTKTTGRIEFDATGRIDFVDAKTGRLVKTEGECVVVNQ